MKKKLITSIEEVSQREEDCKKYGFSYIQLLKCCDKAMEIRELSWNDKDSVYTKSIFDACHEAFGEDIIGYEIGCMLLTVCWNETESMIKAAQKSKAW